MRSLSSSMTKLLLQSAAAPSGPSRHFLQRGRSGDWCGKLSTVLGSRLRRMARGQAVQDLTEAFLGQILVGIVPDQNHWRVDACAEAFDLLPAEIAVL